MCLNSVLEGGFDLGGGFTFPSTNLHFTPFLPNTALLHLSYAEQPKLPPMLSHGGPLLCCRKAVQRNAALAAGEAVPGHRGRVTEDPLVAWDAVVDRTLMEVTEGRLHEGHVNREQQVFERVALPFFL